MKCYKGFNRTLSTSTTCGNQNDCVTNYDLIFNGTSWRCVQLDISGTGEGGVNNQMKVSRSEYHRQQDSKTDGFSKFFEELRGR